MKPSEIQAPAAGHIGHVKNGVIVVDKGVSLSEGQTVRIEPLTRDNEGSAPDAHSDQLSAMKALFSQWDLEDNQVPDETAAEFHKALAQNRGLRLHKPNVE
jgi:hypothetical protein